MLAVEELFLDGKCENLGCVGAGADLRVLDLVKYDTRGVRHESFSSAVARIREEPMQHFN